VPAELAGQPEVSECISAPLAFLFPAHRREKKGTMQRILLLALITAAFVVGASSAFAQQYQTNVTTPPSPAIVVDSTGVEVGPLINTGGADSALKKSGTNKFALQVNSKGFVATGVFFSYTTSNCGGTRYVFSPASNSLYISYPKTDNGTGFLSYYSGGVAKGILYYATQKTSKKLTVNSERVLNPDGTIGACFPLASSSTSLSLVSTFNIATLPFTPPFKVTW
jgi:hypothetical protein